MCGRYNLTTPARALADLFRVSGALPNLPARYNIAPSQDAPVIRPAEGGREMAMLRWGLVPSWAKEIESGLRMINARGETVAEKPAYRAAFRKRRCLVPADGFYEWRADGGRKQPYHIRLKTRAPFALAGLWEHWERADIGVIESFTIIVTSANDLLKPIHDRMPVILAMGDVEAWLDTEATSPAAAQALLRPYPPEEMEAIRVGTWVNNPRHDDPRCVAPEGEAGAA